MSFKDFYIFHPQESNPNEYYVDDTFKREILLHICKNRIKSIKAPLILSIQGKKGEGKTTHVIEICKKINVIVLFIHGSAIGGQFEKEPADLIKRAYIEASSYYKLGKTSIILIDDIDTSIASTIDDRKYTVNSQLVNGTLMNIADNPNCIGEVATHRVPIIFTGNNLTNLYSPLRRNGRMKVFSWEPNHLTKMKIIKHIFKENINEIEMYRFDKFISSFINNPISFFIDLKNELFNESILKIIDRTGEINFTSIDRELSILVKSKFSIDIIKNKADILLNTVLKNYTE